MTNEDRQKEGKLEEIEYILGFYGKLVSFFGPMECWAIRKPHVYQSKF